MLLLYNIIQVESGSYSDAKDQQEQILAVDVTPSYTDTGYIYCMNIIMTMRLASHDNHVNNIEH